jgi:hypothetical protein
VIEFLFPFLGGREGAEVRTGVEGCTVVVTSGSGSGGLGTFAGVGGGGILRASFLGGKGGGAAGVAEVLGAPITFFSDESPVQLVARSPNALAMPPQRPLLLGGTGGFSGVATVLGLLTAALEGVVDVGVAGITGISSSHTLSTIPVRTNDHSSHVARSLPRHQPEVQRGYMVMG